jgi:hypothetical protein
LQISTKALANYHNSRMFSVSSSLPSYSIWLGSARLCPRKNLKNVHLCSFMLQYGWYLDNSNDFSGVKIWKMSIYVHLRCSTGDILIIQMILGWKFEKCPFMSIYDAVRVIFWYFKESQKKHLSELKNILCTLLGYPMYTVFFNSGRCHRT